MGEERGCVIPLPLTGRPAGPENGSSVSQTLNKPTHHGSLNPAPDLRYDGETDAITNLNEINSYSRVILQPPK